jgi:hypothetical protein
MQFAVVHTALHACTIKHLSSVVHKIILWWFISYCVGSYHTVLVLAVSHSACVPTAGCVRPPALS